MHHIHNSPGLCHGPRWEAHSATLTPLQELFYYCFYSRAFIRILLVF